MRVQTWSRNHRSWVTHTSADRRSRRCWASQAMPSTSRWLVGSSRTIRSCSSMSSLARAIRRRSPPESGPMTVSSPCGNPGMSSPPNSPVSTSRILALPAHSWSARSPMTSCRTVAAGSRESCCVSTPSRSPPEWVTRPVSGSSSLASIRIMVVLPSPLRPTTPMRSPSETPRDTPSRRARVPYTLLTFSTLTRLTAISLLPGGSLDPPG